MGAQCACMYREVVHSLFGLLNEGVAVDFPCQVLDLAAYLFESLIDGDGSHGDGAVADNPFACLMDVVARGEVHEGVASPVAAPYGLAHLFLDARGEGGVADVGVEFHEEVAPYDHRLGFGVVGVGGNDGTACGHFLTDEFGSDMAFDAERAGIVVLAYGHIFHLGGDYSLAGEGHLGDCLSLLGAQGSVAVGEAYRIEAAVCFAHTSVVGGDVREAFKVVAPGCPLFAYAREAFVDVDFHCGVGVDAAGVVDVDGGVLAGELLAVDDSDRRHKVDTAHGHLYRMEFAIDIYFLGTGVGVHVDVFDFHYRVFFLCQ